MAESSTTSQQTMSSLEGADVAVYVRWRPLIPEESGHSEIARTSQPEGAMQRVQFSLQKTLAGTNVLAEKKIEVSQPLTPLTPRSKRKAVLAKRLRKREEKANTFSGLLHGVFEGEDNNQSVYDNSVKHCVNHVLNGGVGAVFTYGQTASGKTHTILGYGEEQGVAHQALEALMKEIQGRDDAWVNVSFTAMHKRSVYDLLNNRSQAAARENADGDVVFRKYTASKDRNRDVTEGAFEIKKVQCRTSADARAAIQTGVENRAVGNSNIHDQSSRSHAFLEYEATTVEIESFKKLVAELQDDLFLLAARQPLPKKVRCTKNSTKHTLDQSLEHNQILMDFMTPEQLATTIKGKGYVGLRNFYTWLIKQVEAHIEVLKAEAGSVFSGKMVLVDLAGSEHGADKRNNAQTAEQWQESKQINISLAALNDVLYALHSGKSRVPYRASILTRVLRKYLNDGRCKTVMIGNLSPSAIHSGKSMKTLRYCRMVAKAGTEREE